MNIAYTRVAKELKELQKSAGNDGVFIESESDDLSKLKGHFNGPSGTPYQGGDFKVSISIPTRYPFVPPIVKFETKIWHPNISSVTGIICLDILKDQWAAAMSLRTVLISLQALLCNPEPSDPQDAVVAGQLLSHPKIFSHIAKQWTRLFASGPTMPFEDKEFDDKVAILINMGVKKAEAVSVLSNHNLSIQHAVERYFS